MLVYVPSLSNHWMWASSSHNALIHVFHLFNPLRFWRCECMLFHSWLQHAMTTSVTFSCFLSCSSSLSFSSFSAPVISLLQTTHCSSVWIDSQDLVFLFYSALVHPFLMLSINFSLVWISVIKFYSFWVWKCFSFSLSFWVFFSPCVTRTLPCRLCLHRYKLIFTPGNWFYRGRNWFLLDLTWLDQISLV